MMLELHHHRSAVFLTLTYSDEHLPKGGVLVKRDLQLYLKRLRMACSPIRIRFFAVGEYGERTSRPHYHLIVYGLGPENEDIITKAWSLGFVHIGSVTSDSIQYCTGYVSKKMTAVSDPRLEGRPPEFAVMSRRPGLGAASAQLLGEDLTKSSGAALWLAREGDVPKVARMDGKFFPLGRYMVGKVRLAVGMENENCPESKKAEYLAGMRDLRESVGNAAFRHAKPFVDWSKAGSVIARHKAKASLSKKVF